MLILNYMYGILSCLIDDDGIIWIPYYRDGKETGYFGGSDGSVLSTHFIKPKRLKETTTNKGYQQLKLRINKKYVNVLVHTIICTCFNGDPPDDSFIVDHWDDDRQNNKPGNLRWVTYKTNNSHNKKRYTLEDSAKKDEIKAKRWKEMYGEEILF